MLPTSRIIVGDMSTLVAFQCVCIFGLAAELSPRRGCVLWLLVRGQLKVTARGNTNNCLESCFQMALPLPSWVLNRDWGQKAGQQQSRGNGRGIERTAPSRPNAL